MSLLYMDGFDSQEFNTKGWTLQGSGGGISPGQGWVTGRLGGSALYTSTFSYNSNGSAYAQRSLTASSQITLGCAVNLSVYNNDNGFMIGFATDSGASNQLFVISNYQTQKIELRLGSPFVSATVLASSSAVMPVNIWQYIEIQATIASSGGTCTVRLNGQTVPIISYTGNTMAGGTSTNIDTIQLGSVGGNGNGSTIYCKTYFDDLYVFNSLGTTNNTFIGDAQVQTLLPNGPGSSTQFTPTGNAANWQNVNDVPDSTSTYNSSSTSGQRDTYAMGDLSSGTGTVYGVQQTTHAFKTTSGTGQLKSAQKSGTTVSYGATHILSTSNVTYLDLFETNPATSAAFTPNDVNNLEAGAEIV